MSEESCKPVATDSQGRVMRLHWLFVFCGIEEIKEARQLAYDFMTRSGRRYPADPDTLFNLQLRPVGSNGEATAYGCIRQCWCDEFGEHKALSATDYSHLKTYGWMEADLQTALTALGMEVVS